MQLLTEHWRFLMQSIAFAFIFAVLALWGANVTIEKSQYLELKSYSSYALNYASDVTDDLKHSITTAKQSPYDVCSSGDIEWLRSILWNHKYLKDIGRVYNGMIHCTAERGLLPVPIKLPPSDTLLSNGIEFWRNSINVIGTHFQTDLALDGSVLTMTSPFAFDAMRDPNQKISTVIVDKNKDFVFRLFGNRTDSLLDSLEEKGSIDKWLKSGTRSALHYYDCSNVGLCVLSEDRSSGVFGASWLSIALISSLGGFGGLGVSSLAYKTHRKRHSIAFHLKRAIAKNELSVVFQPKICLASGNPVGAEALLRWNSAYFGFVSPEIFISVAEKKGLIRKITHFVIEKSLEKTHDVMRLRPEFRLNINVSIQDLMDPDLLTFIIQTADRFDVSLSQLVFEVTERSAGDDASLAEVVQKYIDAGVSISLDDFGTGYSNLAWLGRLNASEIKVDKSFTQSIGTGSINQTMLDAIFSLLHGLDVACVFEGVETQEQADYIYRACPQALVQGWLYAKPMIAPQLKKYLDGNDDDVF